MRTLIALLCLSFAAAACGGASVESSAPAEPVPAAQPATPAPTPVVEATPAPDPRADLIWYVYWEGIHCLTVYPMAGLIRSEEPQNANPTFQSRSDHFSIISVYWEREADWAPEIEAASDLDDLLARFGAMAGVEIEEAVNPVQDSGF